MAMQQLLQQALQALRVRDRATAFRMLQQALQHDPQNVSAWILLSHAVDDPQRRRECLERAVAIDPNSAEAREELEQLRIQQLLAGTTLLSTGQFGVSPRRFGEYLVEKGYVTYAQLDEAIQEQRMFYRPGRSVPLGEILVRRGWLSVQQLTDILALQQSERVAGDQSSLRLERLGEYLVAQGCITPQQCAAALVEQFRFREQGRSIKLGELLVSRGYITRQALDQALELQMVDYHRRFM
jgi:tetratricopeptide (TPR) repeat protein